MDTIGNILKDNDTKPEEKLPVCKFCGKPYIWYKKELFSGKRKGEKELQNKKRADTKLYRQSREKIYIKGISQRRMPDFLGGHPDNLTELISYRIIGVP